MSQKDNIENPPIIPTMEQPTRVQQPATMVSTSRAYGTFSRTSAEQQFVNANFPASIAHSASSPSPEPAATTEGRSTNSQAASTNRDTSTSASKFTVVGESLTIKESDASEDSDSTAPDPQENYECLYIPPERPLCGDQNNEIAASFPEQGVTLRGPQGLVLHASRETDSPSRPLPLQDIQSPIRQGGRETDRDWSKPWHCRNLDPGSVPQMTIDPQRLSLARQRGRAAPVPTSSSRNSSDAARYQQRRERARRTPRPSQLTLGARQRTPNYPPDRPDRHPHGSIEQVQNSGPMMRDDRHLNPSTGTRNGFVR